jgi:hypothetical protein
MDIYEWSKSNADYGRKLIDSGLEGARSGRDEFLNGEPLGPFLGESALNAWKAASVGACVGVMASFPGRRRSIAKTLALGLLGGAVGFGAGLLWESRHLTASVADGAMRNIGKVRDERWLSKNPIDYA